MWHQEACHVWRPLKAIMPCFSILWPLVPNVWELFLTLKWKVKLSLKSSTANEAGTVTDCACIMCCLQWSLCNISSLHRWMLRMIPSKLSKMCWCSFLEKLWVLAHWVWSHIYLHGFRSKAALYNSVEVMPVWKRCKRTFWFVQCSMAISPLKKTSCFEPTSKAVIFHCGYSFKKVEGRHGLFTVCISCSAIKWVNTFLLACLLFSWSGLWCCWKYPVRQCSPAKVSCHLGLLGENTAVSPHNHTLV